MRPEFSPLGHYGVEIAQVEQNGLKFQLLGANLHSFLVEIVQGLVYVGHHAGRGLICNFDGAFQNPLGNYVGVGRGCGFGGEEDSIYSAYGNAPNFAPISSPKLRATWRANEYSAE